MNFNVNEARRVYLSVFGTSIPEESIRLALKMQDFEFNDNKPFDSKANGTHSDFTFGEWDSIEYSRIK